MRRMWGVVVEVGEVTYACNPGTDVQLDHQYSDRGGHGTYKIHSKRRRGR